VTRLIIPLFAAILGAAALLFAGGFDDRHVRAGTAFLTLIHASHAAAEQAHTPARR